MDVKVFYKIARHLVDRGGIILDDDLCFNLQDQPEQVKDAALKLFIMLAPASVIGDTWCDLDHGEVQLMLINGFINPASGFNDLLNSLYLEFEHAIDDGLSGVIPALILEREAQASNCISYDLKLEMLQ